VLQRGFAFAIFLSYVVLPTVSRSVFETWSCENFGYIDDPTRHLSDDPTLTRSFMRTDGEVVCEVGGPSDSPHNRLAQLSYGLLVLWPLGMPAAYAALLYKCRSSIRRRTQSFLSASTHFLWREYEARFYWWEVASILMKLVRSPPPEPMPRVAPRPPECPCRSHHHGARVRVSGAHLLHPVRRR